MSIDPQTMLTANLREVLRLYDARKDDWRYSLVRTFKEYLRATGTERELIFPVQALLSEIGDAVVDARRKAEGKRGTLKPINKTVPPAYAAAAVTTLRLHHGQNLQEAVATVSKASGIAKRDLKEFRDGISRDRAAGAAKGIYDKTLKEMHDWSEETIIEAVSGIGRFVK